MHFSSVMFASPTYDQMVQLRLNNLYNPLNAEISEEDFATEYKDVHLAVFDDHMQLLGAILINVFEEEDEFYIKRKIALLKQVVIQKDLQGKGVGTQMIQELEALLIKKGYKEARIHAHSGAIEFYTKLGYTKHAKPFVETGIEQQAMKKKLQSKSSHLDKFEPVGNEQ